MTVEPILSSILTVLENNSIVFKQQLFVSFLDHQSGTRSNSNKASNSKLKPHPWHCLKIQNKQCYSSFAADKQAGHNFFSGGYPVDMDVRAYRVLK